VKCKLTYPDSNTTTAPLISDNPLIYKHYNRYHTQTKKLRTVRNQLSNILKTKFEISIKYYVKNITTVNFETARRFIGQTTKKKYQKYVYIYIA